MGAQGVSGMMQPVRSRFACSIFWYVRLQVMVVYMSDESQVAHAGDMGIQVLSNVEIHF